MSGDIDFRDPNLQDGPEADRAFAEALAQALGGEVITNDAPQSSPVYWTFDQGRKFEGEEYVLPIPDGYVAFPDGKRDFVAVEEQYRSKYEAGVSYGLPTIIYGGEMLPLTAPEEYREPCVRDLMSALLVKAVMEKQLQTQPQFVANLYKAGLFEAGERPVYGAALNTAGGVSYQFAVPGPKSSKMIRVQTMNSPMAAVDAEMAAMLNWLGKMEWKHPHVRRKLTEPALLRDKSAWLKATDDAVKGVMLYQNAQLEFCMAANSGASNEVLFPAMRERLERARTLLGRTLKEADEAASRVPGMGAADYDKLVVCFKDMQPNAADIDEDHVEIPVLPEFKPTLDRWRATAENLRASERAEAERRAAEEAARREREAAEEAKRKEREAEEARRRKREMQELALRRREEWREAREMIGSSTSAFAYVKPDRTVGEFHNVFMNSTDGKNRADVSKFKDIRAVACCDCGIVGLRTDGSCIATDPGKYCDDHIYEANSWRNIQALAAGDHHVVGLRTDGTCVGTSIRSNVVYSDYGQSRVSGWTDIIAIACGDSFTIGLKKDGTVVYTGDREYVHVAGEVATWRDVELIAAGGKFAAGLTRDGMLLTAGDPAAERARDAEGIVQLAIFGGTVFALQCDGDVYGGPRRRYSEMGKKSRPVGSNVIALASGLDLLMLTEDGRILINYFRSRPSELPNDLRIFDSYNALRAERQAKEAARLAEEQKRAGYRAANRCQHCGGEFKKKLFSYKCLNCGRSKDY